MLAIPEDMLRMLQAALMHCICRCHIQQSLQVRRKGSSVYCALTMASLQRECACSTRGGDCGAQIGYPCIRNIRRPRLFSETVTCISRSKVGIDSSGLFPAFFASRA